MNHTALLHARYILLMTAGLGAAGSACGTAASEPASAAAFSVSGRIQGWPNPGEAVIVASSDALHGPPVRLGQGTVGADGAFTVPLPLSPPPEAALNVKSDCPDLVQSDPNAVTVETGTFTLFQNGTPIGATFLASSLGAATFTKIVPGDVRAGFIWADRDVTTTGQCVFHYSAPGFQITLYQDFHLTLTKGYNRIFAVFGRRADGSLTSDLEVGPPPSSASWLFIPPSP